MQEDYIKWYSPNLNAEIEMLTFGFGGHPLVLFPTSKGRYYENKDFKLIESVQQFLEKEKVIAPTASMPKAGTIKISILLSG